MVGTGLVTTRREARILVLQALCESDTVNHGSMSVLDRMIREYDVKSECSEFSLDLVSHVLENVVELDNIIKEFAPTWPITQMATVDRNLLRMGIAEILWVRGSFEGVVANEAVELAKVFGSGSSGGFVNGVLGSFLSSND